VVTVIYTPSLQINISLREAMLPAMTEDTMSPKHIAIQDAAHIQPPVLLCPE